MVYINNRFSLLKFQTVSAVFVAILGTLLHFTYEWSNQNLFVGAFSAVNESTWEHLKLLFFPMLIMTIIGNLFFRKNIPNFLCSKTIGIITSILFTIIFFYTSGGIIGENFAILNIATFYIAVILGEYIAYKAMIVGCNCNNKLAFCTLIILFFCFIIFTYNPPQIGLFEDPLTSNYGIF